MRFRLGLVGLIAVFFLAGSTERADAASPHYVNGSGGLEVASVAPPGWYYRNYSLYYSADKVRNQEGRRLDIDFDLDIYMNFNTILYSSDCRFLGGRYLAAVAVPFTYVDIEVAKTFGQRPPDFLGFHNFRADRERIPSACPTS